MRDHIVSHKNDHGASYGRYGALQWWSWLKSAFARFSASFSFRLLQHYRPFGDMQISPCVRFAPKSGPPFWPIADVRPKCFQIR